MAHLFLRWLAALSLRIRGWGGWASFPADDDIAAQRQLADISSELAHLSLLRTCMAIICPLGCALDQDWSTVQAIARALVRTRALTSAEANEIALAPGPYGPPREMAGCAREAPLATRLFFGVRDLLWELQGQSSCVRAPQASSPRDCHPLEESWAGNLWS